MLDTFLFPIGTILRHRMFKGYYHKLCITGYSPDNYHFCFMDMFNKKISVNIGSDWKSVIENEWEIDINNYNKVWREINDT